MFVVDRCVLLKEGDFKVDFHKSAQMRDEMKIELTGTRVDIRYHVVTFTQHTFLDKWIKCKVVGVRIDHADKHGVCVVVVDRNID